MSAKRHLNDLLETSYENAKKIGQLEEQHRQAIVSGDYKTMIASITELRKLYSKHYSLQREIIEAGDIIARSKTRFQRLFHK